MMLALECAPPRARVHLFGFNWSRRAWAAHKMGAEEAFARRLDAAGRIRIHWPACAGMRGCGGCAVLPCSAAVWTCSFWQGHCEVGCPVLLVFQACGLLELLLAFGCTQHICSCGMLTTTGTLLKRSLRTVMILQAIEQLSLKVSFIFLMCGTLLMSCAPWPPGGGQLRRARRRGVRAAAARAARRGRGAARGQI